MFSSTTIYIPVQKYVFQYNNIYSSTKICFPVQQYIFQYNNIYSSTKICFPVQQYLFQYRKMNIPVQIYIFILVQNSKFQYRNISFSTKICSCTEICTFQYRNTAHANNFKIQLYGIEATWIWGWIPSALSGQLAGTSRSYKMAAFLSICECGADISNYEHKFCTSCGRELLPDEKSIITFYFSRGFEYKSILHMLSKQHGIKIGWRNLAFEENWLCTTR